jgi:hypothetical protein
MRTLELRVSFVGKKIRATRPQALPVRPRTDSSHDAACVKIKLRLACTCSSFGFGSALLQKLHRLPRRHFGGDNKRWRATPRPPICDRVLRCSLQHWAVVVDRVVYFLMLPGSCCTDKEVRLNAIA